MSDVTQILNAIEGGDPKAADDLLPIVVMGRSLNAPELLITPVTSNREIAASLCFSR